MLTTPKKFENTALSLGAVRPTVYTNSTWLRNFSKTRFSLGYLKMPTYRFSVDKEHFENGDFRKQWHHHNYEIALSKPKMTVDCLVFKLFQPRVCGASICKRGKVKMTAKVTEMLEIPGCPGVLGIPTGEKQALYIHIVISRCLSIHVLSLFFQKNIIHPSDVLVSSDERSSNNWTFCNV